MINEERALMDNRLELLEEIQEYLRGSSVRSIKTNQVDEKIIFVLENLLKRIEILEEMHQL
jgi:hypothetical protein